MNPEEKHIDPSLGIGDVFRYSNLIGAIVSAIASVSSIPVGGETDLPPLKTWLPDGHSYELDIHLKKTK